MIPVPRGDASETRRGSKKGTKKGRGDGKTASAQKGEGKADEVLSGSSPGETGFLTVDSVVGSDIESTAGKSNSDQRLLRVMPGTSSDAVSVVL